MQVDVAIKVAGIHWCALPLHHLLCCAGAHAPPPTSMCKPAPCFFRWYKSRSHAAEMTAGYYNYLERDGYEPIARLLKPCAPIPLCLALDDLLVISESTQLLQARRRKCGFSFTCIEMSDTENPDLRHCSPEGALCSRLS